MEKVRETKPPGTQKEEKGKESTLCTNFKTPSKTYAYKKVESHHLYFILFFPIVIRTLEDSTHQNST